MKTFLALIFVLTTNVLFAIDRSVEIPLFSATNDVESRPYYVDLKVAKTGTILGLVIKQAGTHKKIYVPYEQSETASIKVAGIPLIGLDLLRVDKTYGGEATVSYPSFWPQVAGVMALKKMGKLKMIKATTVAQIVESAERRSFSIDLRRDPIRKFSVEINHKKLHHIHFVMKKYLGIPVGVERVILK